MLNGKTSFDIPNVPEDHVLQRFNVLFAYVFEAVSGGKGMMQLKIDPSKNQTINNLVHETFPTLKCFDNEKLRVMNPKLVAYVHALIIDCITIPFEATINSRAHQHEGAMMEVYSKMKPDSFTSQLQTALTAYHEDIMGLQGASGCSKVKVIKRKFEDQVATDAADADADAADAAANPANQLDGGAGAEAAEAGGEDPTPPSGGAVKAPAGAARGGGRRAGGKA
jgi:hypothetical protein